MTPYKVVPTWDNGNWTETTFYSREEFKEFVTSCFKEPGTYEFDETAQLFNAQATLYNTQKYYCSAPKRSKDFMAYWDDQKAKCRQGCIFKSKGKTWYLTRDYYMWINFLPIYDKINKKFDFPQVWDGQYHMALYELLAELNYKHVAILKKRQFGSSYFHIAKLINTAWFEEGAVLKMGASLKDYINEKGSWKFWDEYKNFLNAHTAWYRPGSDKAGSWKQQIEVTTNGRKSYSGLKSTFNIYSFEKDPTNGVGGPVVFFFHEEAGIAPKMDTTFEYILPALKAGMVTTGTFIAAGSVGDLDQCEPLKVMMMEPDANDIFAVETNLLDEHNTPGRSGLFIPEQWSMPPFIDTYGNSQVKEALEAIKTERIKWKKELTPEKYQLRISQKPTNISEAFASRKVSIFPPHLVAAQMKRIEDKTYPVQYVDIKRTTEGKLFSEPSNKSPILEFPIGKKTEDKTGVICIYERPIPGTPWGTYYASVDPVGSGKTNTSESLCSIYVYKNPVEVTKDDGHGNMITFIEGDKLVASWCGRFDDINKTHERLENIIEYYNAWTIVENNVYLFIQYMISQKKQKYLVPKDQITFLKDLGSNANVFQDYGWKNTGVLFKTHMLAAAIQFTQEEIDVDTNAEGEVIRKIHGVERIPDPMLLVEMQQYQHGLNVDRLIAFCSLVAFAKVQQANRRALQRTEKDDNLENSAKNSNLYKKSTAIFRHMGQGQKPAHQTRKRSAFKNLR